MILLGVLLLLLDVAPAMVLFGVTQFASNGWRATLWRSYVQWSIVGQYALGAVLMFGLLKLVSPSCPTRRCSIIGLGIMPFLVDRLPPMLQPDITRRGAPLVCGAIITLLSIMAGAAGNVLDVFFQQSKLDRKTIVATKAATQTLAHLLRIFYFGSFVTSLNEALPLWVYAGAIVLAFSGTSLAAFVLHRMTDADFRRWSRLLIRSVSLIYLGPGTLAAGNGLTTRGGEGGLLAGPHDAGHPGDVRRRHGAVGVLRVERAQLEGLGRAALQFLHQHLPVIGLDDHAIPAPDGGGGEQMITSPCRKSGFMLSPLTSSA